jgi:hypothetical protein
MTRIGSSRAAPGRLVSAVLCIGLFLLGALSGLAPAQAARGRAAQRSLIQFDIPAQSLATALDAFCRAAGVQVLYDSQLASGRRSNRVAGSFTPEVALQALLQGTDLTVHYTPSDDIVLGLASSDPVSGDVLPPTSGAVLLLDPIHVDGVTELGTRPDFRSYGRIVMANVREALYTATGTRSGSYDIAVDLWVGPTGSVLRSRIARSTGDEERDAEIARVLRGLTISKAPPAGMPQPVSVAINAHSR